MTCLVRSGGGHVTAAQLRPVRPRGGGQAGRPPARGRAAVAPVYEPACQAQPLHPGGRRATVCPSAWVRTCMCTCVAVCLCVWVGVPGCRHTRLHGRTGK